MFRFLWSSSGNQNTNDSKSINKNNKKKNTPFSIPDYEQGSNEDSIDLQIKSLIYMFRRYKIHLFAHFLKQTELGKYELDWFNHSYDTSLSSGNGGDKEVFICNEKLDVIYNKEKFEQVILNDPYRILIDYSKNKFRSMLILSEEPSIDMQDKIPEFPYENFKFIVLKPESEINEYLDKLVNKSFIYCEHKVPNSVKVEILKDILIKYYKKPSFKMTKDDRSLIIQNYLQQLAVYIQVDRINKATLKSRESLITTANISSLKHNQNTLHDISNVTNNNNNNITITTAPHLRSITSISNIRPTSPLRSRRDSNDPNTHTAYPRLRSSKSLAQLNTTTSHSTDNIANTATNNVAKSPIRTLREKPSMSILKMDKVYESTRNKRNHLTNTIAESEEEEIESDLDNFSSCLSSDDDSFNVSFDEDYESHELQNSHKHAKSKPNHHHQYPQQQLHSNTIVQTLSSEEKKSLYEQSKSAVLSRIEREKQILQSIKQ